MNIDKKIIAKIIKYQKEAERAMSINIKTQDDFEMASDVVKAIKIKIAELTNIRLGMTRPLDESKRKIMIFFSGPLDMLHKAETTIKYAMSKYLAQQEAKRLEQEQKLLARKQAEIDKLQMQMNEAIKNKDDEKVEKLEAKLSTIEAMQPVVNSVIDQRGVVKRTIWKFRIVDVNLIPREYLIPDEKKLGEIARATKGSIKIPGVEFYSEDIVAVNTNID